MSLQIESEPDGSHHHLLKWVWLFSSGASGGCLHGGASFKLEKAHFAAHKHEVKLRPPVCRPLKQSMMFTSSKA